MDSVKISVCHSVNDALFTLVPSENQYYLQRPTREKIKGKGKKS